MSYKHTRGVADAGITSRCDVARSAVIEPLAIVELLTTTIGAVCGWLCGGEMLTGCQEDTDRMPTADGVARVFQIRCKVGVTARGDDAHAAFVDALDRLVYLRQSAIGGGGALQVCECLVD